MLNKFLHTKTMRLETVANWERRKNKQRDILSIAALMSTATAAIIACYGVKAAFDENYKHSSLSSIAAWSLNVVTTGVLLKRKKVDKQLNEDA